MHKTLWTFFWSGLSGYSTLIAAFFLSSVWALKAPKSSSPDKELDLEADRRLLSFTAGRSAPLALCASGSADPSWVKAIEQFWYSFIPSSFVKEF